METRFDPETGAALKRDVRPMTVRVGSCSEQVMVGGWYPEGDGDGIHVGTDLGAYDEAWKRLRARYAQHLRASRKKWKLTQEQAGALIGGGKRAFQKYESGKAVPTEAAIGLIEILNANPENIEVLKRVRELA